MPTKLGNFSISITFITLPFHILMMKVLFFDLRLALPRHMVLFCLSISDALHIFMTFSCATAMKIFRLTAESDECNVVRKILFFDIATTMYVSSLSIVALSVERYVACIHSFRLHEIFTRERMIYGISFTWISGVVCGAIIASLKAPIQNEIILDANPSINLLLVIIVMPTSVLVSGIQLRLFAFSRKKLSRVRPRTMFGCEAEMANLRKKQIKVAFVASIVVFVYIVSMYPAAFLSFLELIKHNISSATIRSIMKAMTFVNNFADPYLYGIGIADTRKALVKNLRKMKEFFKWQSSFEQ